MAKKEKPVTAGDLLIHEESAIRCRESVVVTNPTAAEYFAPVGSPIKADGTIAVATEEGSVVGLTLEPVTLAASGNSGVALPYIARDAAVNQAKIPTKDPAGTDYTLATILSTILALGIVARQEPSKYSIQVN